ncbi:MAG TPA: OsmC family protein [Pyrinomonadaceae bacterium]|nr:OsmC family protein [Pyrinomonadaceae bacterium]
MSIEAPKATIIPASDDLFVATTPNGTALTIDTNSERHLAPSPMELLLLALGSCTAVDVINILKKRRERVTDYRVEVRGERREDHPRGYRRLWVHHIIRGHHISTKAVAQAIELSENKYCSVAASLRPAAEILSSYDVIEDPEITLPD